MTSSSDDLNRALTVHPNLARMGMAPELIEGPVLLKVDGFSYRAEAWKLVDGESVVIVRSLNAPSLTNKTEGIAYAVDTRWGPGAIIIEDWAPGGYNGDRFRLSSRAGLNDEVDFAALVARGLVLAEGWWSET